MYFLKPISNEIRSIQVFFHKQNNTMKLMLVAEFACMATILQASGGFLPGIGYFISPLATAPILLCSVICISLGLMSYILTIMLLLILQPAELFVFPFTTGLLGLGIGLSFSIFRRRISVILTGSILLFLGIISLLYIFQFPILGPAVDGSFSLLTIGSILIFAFLYSWLWVDLSIFIFKKINKVFF